MYGYEKKHTSQIGLSSVTKQGESNVLMTNVSSESSELSLYMIESYTLLSCRGFLNLLSNLSGSTLRRLGSSILIRNRIDGFLGCPPGDLSRIDSVFI